MGILQGDDEAVQQAVQHTREAYEQQQYEIPAVLPEADQFEQHDTVRGCP